MPVIASGGAGAVEHFPPAVEAGADAVLAASVFHFGQLRIGDVKAGRAAAGPASRCAARRTTSDRARSSTCLSAGQETSTRATPSAAGRPQQQLHRLALDGPAARAEALLAAGDVGAPQDQPVVAARRRGGRRRRREGHSASWSFRGQDAGLPARLGAAHVLVVDRELGHVDRLGRPIGQASGDHGGGPARTRATTSAYGRRPPRARPAGAPRRRAVRRGRPPRGRSRGSASGRRSRTTRCAARCAVVQPAQQVGASGPSVPAGRPAPRAHGSANGREEAVIAGGYRRCPAGNAAPLPQRLAALTNA